MAERRGTGGREVTEDDDQVLEMEPSKVYGAEHLLRLFGESLEMGGRGKERGKGRGEKREGSMKRRAETFDLFSFLNPILIPNQNSQFTWNYCSYKYGCWFYCFVERAFGRIFNVSKFDFTFFFYGKASFSPESGEQNLMLVFLSSVVLSNLSSYMMKEQKRLFVAEYESASPAYHRLSTT